MNQKLENSSISLSPEAQECIDFLKKEEGRVQKKISWGSQIYSINEIIKEIEKGSELGQAFVNTFKKYNKTNLDKSANSSAPSNISGIARDLLEKAKNLLHFLPPRP